MVFTLLAYGTTLGYCLNVHFSCFLCKLKGCCIILFSQNSSISGRRRGGFSGSGCRLTLNFSWVAGPPLCPLCWGSSGQAPSAAAIPLSRSHPTPACQSLLRPRGPAPMGNLPGRLPHTGWPPPPPGSRHTLPSYINDILFFILLLLLLFMSVGTIARSSLF